jgi:cytochrome c oxidase subunit IV
MRSAEKHEGALLYVVAWLVLLLLTGISILTGFLHLGVYAPIVQFGIAATQAAIVFILFMRLKGPPSLKWLFAGAGFFWLLFLYGLSTTDYATRRDWPPPPLPEVSGQSSRP